MTLSFRTYQPASDGITPDTTRFQQALDDLDAQGGGTLVVESGRYLLGGLRLPSNCCLQLDEGRGAHRQCLL